MQQKSKELIFWNYTFYGSLVLYVVDEIFFFSIFYVTIPLTFLTGVVASVFAMKEKAYSTAFVSIICLFVPICRFMLRLY